MTTKSLYVLCATIVCAATVLVSAQQPSLEDTTQFIVGMVDGHGVRFVLNREAISYTYKASIAGGVFSLTELQRPGQTNQWSMSLSDLTPAVERNGSTEFKILHVHCYLGRNCMRAVIDGVPQNTSEAQLLLAPQDGDRVADAMEHAIRLSGGKKQPF